MKGEPSNVEGENFWNYGAYAPENLNSVEPELKKLGHKLLYKINGMTVAIPQFDQIQEL